MKFVIITAIIGITIVESIALVNGVNGTYLTMAVATMAGLAGLVSKTPKILMKLK